ncbi:pseudouridine synthase [Dyadobacter sp. CY356]|uniref:pseudouridine synthase n=1 Tax=Dyadobacter sp. CY356 TaxID=2906442 RepID=UPI001F46EF99|nr:pseudouridine synthase [Dyadobacter sp. CY356]MCF0054884.1 pseudouridine synthase [Dyadobacter sp. CY356]
MLEIVYRDADLIAINKPHGLLVHRSFIAADTSEFAVQILRDQIGQKVYPVHRLDRKTSGVLLFALNDRMNSLMQMQFQEGKVDKRYSAIVRGFTPDYLEIDYPLKRDDGVVQDAFTSFETVQKTELDLPSGKHPTSRYSLVDLHPTTGRMHQLRKHMAHILHPIIGDRPHGCNKQNKFFKEHFEMDSMLLHAREIKFYHPDNQTFISISADYQPEFKRMLNALNFQVS